MEQIEPSWRIIGYNEGYDAGLEHRHMGPQEMLVPDDRLQAIADAWNADYSNIYVDHNPNSLDAEPWVSVDGFEMNCLRGMFPNEEAEYLIIPKNSELVALLDALATEADDGT